MSVVASSAPLLLDFFSFFGAASVEGKANEPPKDGTVPLLDASSAPKLNPPLALEDESVPVPVAGAGNDHADVLAAASFSLSLLVSFFASTAAVVLFSVVSAAAPPKLNDANAALLASVGGAVVVAVVDLPMSNAPRPKDGTSLAGALVAVSVVVVDGIEKPKLNPLDGAASAAGADLADSTAPPANMSPKTLLGRGALADGAPRLPSEKDEAADMVAAALVSIAVWEPRLPLRTSWSLWRIANAATGSAVALVRRRNLKRGAAGGAVSAVCVLAETIRGRTRDAADGSTASVVPTAVPSAMSPAICCASSSATLLHTPPVRAIQTES